jgi:hypothetical protein
MAINAMYGSVPGLDLFLIYIHVGMYNLPNWLGIIQVLLGALATTVLLLLHAVTFLACWLVRLIVTLLWTSGS